jgi:hypothetical protein
VKRALILLAVPAVLQVSSASFEREGEGARIAALGGAGVALPGDPWGFLINPACSMPARARSIGFVHAPSSFGLRELSRSGFVCLESGALGSIAVSGIRFGFDLYRELSFGLSFGAEIAPGFRAGAAVHFFRITIQGYGSAWTLGTDVGLLWAPSGDVQIGFTATNVNAPAIGRAREKLPQTIGVGTVYAPFPGLLVVCDLVKDIRFPPELRFGIEYSPVEPVALRAGAGRDPSTFGGGLGIALDLLVLDYSVVRHEALGFTHRIGVTVRLGDD